MRFSAHHFPRSDVPFGTHRRPFGRHEAESAVLSADRLARILARADSAAERVRRRPVASVLASLSRASEVWAAPNADPFATAVDVLADGTGFSPPVVRSGLGAMVEALRGDAVGALLDRELGGRDALDGDTVRGPRRITHVLSGNLPGLAFAPVVLSLALESAVLVKCAEGDPYSPAAFAATIAEVDPELGDCLVVHDWRGGDRALEAVAFAADVVVASGSDAAIAAIAPRVRGRFFGHGHKLSFALVGRERMGDAATLANKLAVDVALWDQHGCLSPQVCFVEGHIAAERFADAVADALERMRATLPPRRLDLDERTAIGAFRQEAEWRPTTSRDRLIAAAGTDWSISVEHAPRLRPTCLNRCLRIVALEDAAQLATVLAPHRPQLECAGIATDADRAPELAAQLKAAGVHRVCALGEMQTPDLCWRPGGGPRVAAWLERAADEE